MAGYESVQAEIAACKRHYVQALALPGHAAAYMDAIAPTAWAAFPRGSSCRAPERFAEILAFHAMKAAAMPFDQHAFRKASLCGDVPMVCRHWLLHYQQYLPPALRVASREASPDAWLARIVPGPVVELARTIIASGEGGIGTLRARMQAGAAVVVAWKRLGMKKSEGGSLEGLLSTAGISLATAYNAAVRAGLIAARSARDKPAGIAAVV